MNDLQEYIFAKEVVMPQVLKVLKKKKIIVNILPNMQMLFII